MTQLMRVCGVCVMCVCVLIEKGSKWLNLYIYVCVCVCVMCAYVYVCAYLCMCIYACVCVQ